MCRSSPRAPRPGTRCWWPHTCLRPGRRSCASVRPAVRGPATPRATQTTVDCGPRRSGEASRPSPTGRSCTAATSRAPSSSGRSTSASRARSWSRCRASSPSAPPRAHCSASGCMPGARSASGTTRSRPSSPPGRSTRSSSRSSTSRRGRRVGYEALTRFDSGQRPDLCFADAWSVGLGLELELATLEAAVDGGEGAAGGRLARPQRLAAPARRSRAPARDPLAGRTGPSSSRSPSTSSSGTTMPCARRSGPRPRHPPRGRRRGGRGRQLRPHHRAAPRLREARHQPGPAGQREHRAPGDGGRHAPLHAAPPAAA